MKWANEDTNSQEIIDEINEFNNKSVTIYPFLFFQGKECVIVEEIDYGSHHEKQLYFLSEVSKDDVKILLDGIDGAEVYGGTAPDYIWEYWDTMCDQYGIK